MKQFILSSLSLCLLSPALMANGYQQGQQFALQSQAQSLQMLQAFDKQSLPNFNDNPSETRLKPSQGDELKNKGKAYIQINEQAKSINEKAIEFKENPLDKQSDDKAQSAYNQAEKNTPQAACSDGSCIQTNNEVSDDVGTGAVELGALGDVARDVSEKQVYSGTPGIFGARNILCREKWGDVYQDYCRKDGNIFRGTKAEKDLHVAQKEGRAVRVPGGFICARERKKWGKKKCVEKKESWCVFESKLSRIVQVQGRSQLGLNFGVVSYHTNGANCRGFTPEQLSLIQFDSPQMSVALNEVVQEYTVKRRLPSQSTSSQSIEESVNQRRSFQ